MICPTCHHDFWALFACQDNVHRCRACADKQPRTVAVKRFIIAPVPRVERVERPYISRRGRK